MEHFISALPQPFWYFHISGVKGVAFKIKSFFKVFMIVKSNTLFRSQTVAFTGINICLTKL